MMKKIAKTNVLKKRVAMFIHGQNDLTGKILDVQFVKDKPSFLFFYDPYLFAAKRAAGTHRSPYFRVVALDRLTY